MFKILLLLSTLTSLPAWALASLQNGGALPDDPDARLAADFSVRRGDVRASADASGKIQISTNHESVLNYTARFGAGFTPRWAAGAEVQLADRAREGARSTHLSELNFNLGHRDGPALTYVQLTTPVSRSAYEMENQYQLDALGRGFWAFGVGQLWTIKCESTTLYATFEVHHAWPRRFLNADHEGRLVPGFGANGAVGVNQEIKRFSVGASLAESYEDPVAVEADRDPRRGSAQRVFTPTLNVGFDLHEGWTAVLTYADQTILPAATASLMREVGVQLNKNW